MGRQEGATESGGKFEWRGGVAGWGARKGWQM